jgi:YbgC/YbaW family acyl-CoA thioester hydrolase
MIENFKFSTDVDVRISDINYGGHLGNDRYLSLFQDARLRYLKQFGFSEISIGNNTSLIMSQAHINFKAEVFWGDQLKIFTRISSIKATRFIFDYLIVANQTDEKVIATGYTEMVGFDYQQRKVKRLPPDFLQVIKEYEPSVEIL